MELPPTDTFYIEFDTRIEPGKLVATRIRIDQVTITDLDETLRLDLADHPLYRHLLNYVKGNPR